MVSNPGPGSQTYQATAVRADKHAPTPASTATAMSTPLRLWSAAEPGYLPHYNHAQQIIGTTILATIAAITVVTSSSSASSNVDGAENDRTGSPAIARATRLLSAEKCTTVIGRPIAINCVIAEFVGRAWYCLLRSPSPRTCGSNHGAQSYTPRQRATDDTALPP
ncbi:hypothetical protein I553_2695 [Mycobacterium xenopi 4042]|uniref:Uncharacterized protein n=1 Tax=Mycobacterium xenopi 4042 TaxID=1299334 RepID=X8CLP3_MYCXE|nr:hypothetical protein I553_2695 [Mycobacterium xenopi 4042]